MSLQGTDPGGSRTSAWTCALSQGPAALRSISGTKLGLPLDLRLVVGPAPICRMSAYEREMFLWPSMRRELRSHGGDRFDTLGGDN